MPFYSIFSPKKFKKIIFLKIFQVVFILLIGSYLFWILFQKTETQNYQLFSVRSKIQEIKSLNKMEIDLKINYEKLKGNIDSIINFLPPKDKIIDIIAFLEKISNKTKNIQKINLGEKEEPYQENLKKIGVKIELGGNFDSFLDYMKKFENSPYFLNMSDISLSGPWDLEKEGKMTFQTYFIIK